MRTAGFVLLFTGYRVLRSGFSVLLASAVLLAACRSRRTELPPYPASAGVLVARSAERRPLEALPAEVAGQGCADGAIAFTSERFGQRQVFKVCPDGSRLERLLTTDSSDHVAAVAANGTLAILSITGKGGEAHYLERLQLFDGSLKPLGDSRQRLRNPSFLSSELELIGEADLGGMSNIVRIGRDGKLVPLTDDAAGNFEPTVTRDGKMIAFVSSRDGDAEIYRMSVEGTELLRLTRSRGDDTAPAFSPDGRRLAFLSSRRGVVRVHVMNADGGKPRPLDAEAVVGETDLAWSPDGASLAYIAQRAESASLRIVNSHDGSLLTEDSGAFRDETPCFSPDGRSIVFASNRDGDVELYTLKLDGGAVRRVTQAPGVDFLPRWLKALK